MVKKIICNSLGMNCTEKMTLLTALLIGQNRTLGICFLFRANVHVNLSFISLSFSIFVQRVEQTMPVFIVISLVIRYQVKSSME